MIRGTEIYSDIDARVRTTREALDDIAKELQETTAKVERLGREESRDLGRIARVRLEALEAKEVLRGLDDADRRVLQLLEERSKAQGQIQQELKSSEERQRTIDTQRTGHLARLDEARARHGEVVVEALAELEQDEAYQFQVERVENVTAQADRADEKATQTEADRDAKGEPYEESKLFHYLWRRKYGTPAYSAGNLTTALDGWVARLCRYDRARLDYTMLLEIPVRLREHAESLAVDAEEEQEKLGALQRKAFVDAGVPQLADEVESLEDKLAETESALEAEEQAHRKLQASRAELVGGEDSYTGEALRVLRANLEREAVSTLRADAEHTRAPADDTLVAAIAAQRQEAKRLREDARRLRGHQEKALTALGDLEEVRRRYRRSNYDARDSTFRDDVDVGGLLDKLLKGGVVVGDVLNTLKRNHRFEVPRRRRTGTGGGFSVPDFGSSSRRGGSSTRRPRPQPPRRQPPRRPPPRSRSSGGFRTGGGF